MIEVRDPNNGTLSKSMLELNKTFSGGEEHVVMSAPPIAPEAMEISVRLRSSKDVMGLLLAKNALDNMWVGQPTPKFTLTMPYLPYARQDRVTSPGFSFSLKVFANLINSMNFDEVRVCDVHSHVALGLINNIVNFGMDHVRLAMDKAGYCFNGVTLLVPDSGATKRCNDFVQTFGADNGISIVQATKVRNPSTGKITGVEIHKTLDVHKKILVVDDICDGGRTFIELAKVAQSMGVTNMELLVTHGIFSNGFDELGKYYNRIYTTNSWHIGPACDLVKVVDIYKSLRSV